MLRQGTCSVDLGRVWPLPRRQATTEGDLCTRRVHSFRFSVMTDLEPGNAKVRHDTWPLRLVNEASGQQRHPQNRITWALEVRIVSSLRAQKLSRWIHPAWHAQAYRWAMDETMVATGRRWEDSNGLSLAGWCWAWTPQKQANDARVHSPCQQRCDPHSGPTTARLTLASRHS
jgi:hypothetical protein